MYIIIVYRVNSRFAVGPIFFRKEDIDENISIGNQVFGESYSLHVRLHQI